MKILDTQSVFSQRMRSRLIIYAQEICLKPSVATISIQSVSMMAQNCSSSCC